MFCGLVTDWRFATVPTRRSPSFAIATTDGVVRPPSAFGMTRGSPPSITATQEFVVPRSMPITFAMWPSSPAVAVTRDGSISYSNRPVGAGGGYSVGGVEARSPSPTSTIAARITRSFSV